MFDTLEDKADGQEEKKLMCSSDKDKIESFRTKLVVRVKPWRLSGFGGVLVALGTSRQFAGIGQTVVKYIILERKLGN